MNTKTQELVTAGYKLAKGLDVESATLVKQLADELAVQRVRADELNRQVVNLAVENSSLLHKAASELSNAWMLHKYWVGIQVALMHVHNGRLHDAMLWLQNTVAGPGIEVPQLTEFAEIEAWAVEQQKDSIGHDRALEIIKSASPATDAVIANIRAIEAKEIYESILDNPAVTDLESLVDWLESYANNSISFAAELRKGAAV